MYRTNGGESEEESQELACFSDSINKLEEKSGEAQEPQQRPWRAQESPRELQETPAEATMDTKPVQPGEVIIGFITSWNGRVGSAMPATLFSLRNNSKVK